MKRSWDVVVVGLGAMGSCTLRELAGRGLRVLGLDRFRPPHTRGSSHGKSRAIRQAYFEHPAYVPLLREAYRGWEKLARDTGRKLLLPTGCLMLGPPGSPVLEGSLASAREHALEHEVLDAAELRRRYPAFRPEPDTVALFETVAGILKPEEVIETCLRQGSDLGAEVHTEEGVESWYADGEGVTVRTARGTYQAEQLVLCPGAWASPMLTPPMAPDELALDLPLRVVRKVILWMLPQGDPMRFAADRFPMWIWSPEGEEIVYGFPALEGPDGGVKLGIHSGGKSCDPDTADRQVGEEDVTAVRRAVAERVPDLNGDLLKGCICYYTNTPDGHFVVGLHPQQSRVALAAGFSGHGFKFAVVIAHALADLLRNGHTQLPIELFAPQRFAALEHEVMA